MKNTTRCLNATTHESDPNKRLTFASEVHSSDQGENFEGREREREPERERESRERKTERERERERKAERLRERETEKESEMKTGN